MSATNPPAVYFHRAVPQFAVADVVKTAQYYRDVLGFQVASYWDGDQANLATDPPPYFAIVWRDRVQVFFGRAEDGRPEIPHTGGGYHAYFHIVGVDALAAELRARGAHIVAGPEDRIYGERELVVQDCNGFVLTFGENISEHATGRT